MRCLALFTGGLDSLLAVRLIQDQGIEVAALYYAFPSAESFAPVEAAAARLGIELIIVDAGADYARFLRQPRFGYISGAAACVDCRIAQMLIALGSKQEMHADFFISGEVVGQRPRTAIRDLEVVAHHAGLTNLLVRPLSAQLLPPTLPETNGWIDRTKLLGLQGKSRKPQLELARELGLDPPPVRPDCPLLEGPLAIKALDLGRSEQAIRRDDLNLLSIGRHYRFDAKTKAVVGRSQKENVLLAHYFLFRTDSCLLIKPADFAGPTALLSWEGEASAEPCPTGAAPAPWGCPPTSVFPYPTHLAACASLIAGHKRFAPGYPVALLVRSWLGEERVTVAATDMKLEPLGVSR